MNSKIQTIIDFGAKGLIVNVECHLSNNLPNIVIVGYANRAVDEAKERVRGAFASSKLQLPQQRITINLAPADIPKASSSFDLSIAAAIMVAANMSCFPFDGHQAIIGELGLDGSIKAVRGLIGKLLTARNNGINTCFIPSANLHQAKLVPGLTLIPLKHLNGLYLSLSQPELMQSLVSSADWLQPPQITSPMTTIDAISGQQAAKRALQIAAAGGHNLLLSGPPGTGKTMLAKALPSLLPPLSHEEILEVSQLHSLLSNDYEQIITERPFRNPHHSASQTAIIGGGSRLNPGEISLSHHGVLLFDELPEFNRDTLESLRQPLEDHKIIISRAKQTIEYPAQFIFVATANPCPCGYYGTINTQNECNCMPYSIQRYKQKLSGPLLDRIDLYVQVDQVDHSALLSSKTTRLTEQIRDSVVKARAVQLKRYSDVSYKLNGTMTNDQIIHHACIEPTAEQHLNKAAKHLQLSARAYMRTVRVARTIADLANSTTIYSQHINEALQYRNHNYRL